MSRRVARGSLVALLLIAAACQQKKTPPAPVMPAADAMQATGWVGAFAAKPEATQAMLDGNEGWAALYQRDYRTAIGKFGTSTPEATLGLARSHLALARLDDALATLLAESQVRYFGERRKLGDRIQSLPTGAYFEAAAMRLTRGAKESGPLLSAVVEADGPYAPLAKAWLTDCKDVQPWQRPIAAMVCGAQSCDEAAGAKAPALPEPWSTRLAVYQRGLCGQATAGELLVLAVFAAATELIEAGAKDVPDAELTLHDPMALRVLAVHHYRQVIAVAGALPAAAALVAMAKHGLGEASSITASAAHSDPALLVFSPWPSADAVAAALTTPSLPEDLAAALAAASEIRRQTKAAVLAIGTEAGAAMVGSLGLETSVADATLRRQGSAALAQGRCDLAFPLLQASHDLAALDAVSYRNEPRFLVELASAAVCARRSSTAIGTIRAVEGSYAEAAGPLAAVRSLVAAWVVIGGAKGVQRSQ